MALDNYEQAANTAIIIARQEQELGTVAARKLLVFFFFFSSPGEIVRLSRGCFDAAYRFGCLTARVDSPSVRLVVPVTWHTTAFLRNVPLLTSFAVVAFDRGLLCRQLQDCPRHPFRHVQGPREQTNQDPERAQAKPHAAAQLRACEGAYFARWRVFAR